MFSFAARHNGALGVIGRFCVDEIAAFDLGEQLARPVMKRAHRPAFDFMRLETRRCELREGVAPIRKWQLVRAPAEDAMNKNDFAGFETETHRQPPNKQFFQGISGPNIRRSSDVYRNDNAPGRVRHRIVALVVRRFGKHSGGAASASS